MPLFDPSDETVAWIVDYAAGRSVIELGAGDCSLARRLVAAGLKVLAVDPFAELGGFQSILRVHAHRCRLVAQHPVLLIVARPDHSGWVAGVVSRMHSESELLYFGLAGNIETDLSGLEYAVRTPDVGNETWDVCLSLRKQPNHASDLYEQVVDHIYGGPAT